MYWEELTSEDFEKAVKECKGVCLLPIGIIEKHGLHLPMATDMIIARETVRRVAEIEPVIVFPYYYFGQINEAMHHPGTISYSPSVIQKLLEETCDEIARNGCKKIIILNGHGGNCDLLNYFIINTIREKKDYVVYLSDSVHHPEWIPVNEEIRKMIPDGDLGDHGGCGETSMIMQARPDLVHMDRHEPNYGDNLNRLKTLIDNNIYMGMFWYSQYPNHLAGDPKYSDPKFGDMAFDGGAEKVINQIRLIKEDKVTLKLQQNFQDEAGIK